jgi:peptide/nickel transport system substrate-binding protein
VVVATPADADQLIPPLVATLQGKQAIDLLFDYLAEPVDSVETIGDAGFRPALARRWTWAPDSLSIAFELDPRARWHDGRPVRAADVRLSFALYTDPAVGSMHARDFDGIDSVTVRDSLTAVVWWRRRTPEQFFQIAYNLAVMPEHLLGGVPRGALATSPFAAHPVGSGRYRFGAWDRSRQLTFAADTANYRGRPRFDRVVWTRRCAARRWPRPSGRRACARSSTEVSTTRTWRSTSGRGVARRRPSPIGRCASPSRRPSTGRRSSRT